MRFRQLLSEKLPCNAGSDYVYGQPSAQVAWENCTKPSWMLWALDVFELDDAKKNRLFACWCARNTPIGNGKTTWDLLTDQSRNAIIVAERFANGEATNEELSAARQAARDAANSMDASWVAIYAVEASTAADANDAALAASNAAADMTDTCFIAGYKARIATYTAAHAAQAQALRDIYGFPFAHLLQEA